MDDTAHLSQKELRQFGITMAVVIALMFGLLLPWLLSARFPLWPWILSAIFTLPALIAPLFLGPVYKVWMLFGRLMGGLINRTVLSIVFIVVVMPTGLLMRILGKRPIDDKLNRDETQASYRVASNKREPNHMNRPF